VRQVRALVVGTLATGLVAFVFAVALAVVASAASLAFDARLASVRVVAVEHSGNEVATALGPGLLLLALAGGVLNLLAGEVMARRR
jgi:hypothetical protein